MGFGYGVDYSSSLYYSLLLVEVFTESVTLKNELLKQF